MWNPFKQDQSTEARGASKDTQQNNDAKRKEREITAIDKGSFWTVFRYTDRKTGEVRNDLLAKKLRRHLIFPEYSSNQDPKFTKEVAKDEEYNYKTTVALASRYLEKKNTGIIYTSIACNSKVVNLALPPKVFDDNLNRFLGINKTLLIQQLALTLQ